MSLRTRKAVEHVTGPPAGSSATPALRRLAEGCVIPAHPLALDEEGRFDERSQRALTRYYLAAGAGGLAVGVHSTEFAIRDPRVGLYEPVLELAAETVRAAGRAGSTVLVAGVSGSTESAVREAQTARELGYAAALLAPTGTGDVDEDSLIERANAVSEVLPVIGFYLQAAVGGRRLSVDYWRRLAEIEGVVAVKIAPFDRYATLDVVRGVAFSARADEVALYTGNDDTILTDLLVDIDLDRVGSQVRARRIVGGLLGQWGVWTRAAVEIFDQVSRYRAGAVDALPGLLRAAVRLTDANRAVFDAAHAFRGCVPGVKYVLAQQGLLSSHRCLDPHEVLSPGQAAEIDHVRRTYTDLTDDDFVREHVDDWRR
jgi:dihydrodipicolinate synthase/N-acetylneuraminate lyase